MRFLRLIISLTVFLALAAPAFAQESVAVRTGSHKGYVRLVFEWPSKPEYSVSKEGARILVRFSRAGTLDLAGVSAADVNVKKIDTLSSGTEPLQAAITIPDGSRFRDFVVANKLVIDIYDPEGGAQTQKQAAAPEVKPSAPETKETPEEPSSETQKQGKEATPPAPTEQPAPQENAAAAKGDFTISPADNGATAPVTDVEASHVPPPALEPHAITLTSTTSVGLAAFKRNGMLFVVVDNPEMQSAPQITGPQKDRFPPFAKTDLPDGAVYSLELPEGMNVYGEGGGLSWRLVVTGEKRDAPYVSPAVEDETDGAKLVWPLKDMRKVISFTDPMVGDKITVVTAPNAGQAAGPPRNYVNLRSLDSIVGLAYVPKSDDVSATKAIDHVSVGRPEGLSLSAARDLQPEHIRKAAAELPPAPEAHKDKHGEQAADETAHAADAPHDATDPAHEEAVAAEEKAAHELPEEVHAEMPAATTEEISKAGEEKPQGNNIYNFARWEMGGIPALANNMHVMMVEMAGKKPEERPEDLLTMAKLNIANDRGAEALGLMRIALMQVPELEENTEFEALRGAAMALTHKYDEAILDYSREGVKKYDDAKYWLAYTLAGLEDWKQAIAVMPKSFDPIEQYPSPVRMPLVLTFAEIALRGGDVPLANRILDILRPDLAHLPLPYASYWNYLAGEAARQSGEPDKAIEYWEPLVKDGKDDLFRAKAGLSLTKLLLDQKKITSAQAIDTLEGLRYAWRGDELETLINFRLGQMYVDNKDYLKGLTVLRNASTLSPGSDLNRDVKDYMVRTFRDVFNNDRLKNISPLEAISLHEEFKDLIPPGEEGDRFVEKLAERLVDADLLGRAAALLEYQVNNRLKGDKKAEIAIRLAAIRLLDGNPDGALRSLEIAQDTLDKIAGKVPEATDAKPEDIKPEAGESSAKTESKTAKETVDPEKQRQIYLLKARALSMKKETGEAMAILEEMRPDPDVNRLRVDIAWGAARWDDAAAALDDLITAEDISTRRPLTDYQRDLVLNRAIALNLSGNRVALANLRERYNAQMDNTAKGQMFEIITRPRRPDMIGSRQAIDSMISEIDLFKNFLDGYSKMNAKDKAKENGAGTTGAAKTPAPTPTQTGAGTTPQAELTTQTLPEEDTAKTE